MKRRGTPVLEPRDGDAFIRDVLAKRLGFVAGWRPAAGDPGLGLADGFGRFMDALAARLNAAPDKNKLAFYDMLGAALLPAASARAPLAFDALPAVANSHVPARTRVGAKGERPDPIVFETERRIGLVAAPLAEVVTVWPGRDAFADHTDAALRGEAFTLFEPRTPLDHALYLGHHRVLALTGPSTVEVAVTLARAAGEPLRLAWEYWDGEVWRAFKPLESPGAAGPGDGVDGTDGLARDGTIRLTSDCAEAAARRVYTAESYWIRARLQDPLPPRPGQVLPEVDRLTVRTVIDRRLPDLPCASIPDDAGIIAEHAFANETKLDLTKSIEPMGGRPKLGNVFYIGSDEILTRPGAEVTLCFAKVVTPEELADEESKKFEVDVANVAAHIVEAARDGADTILELVQAANDMSQLQPTDLADLISDIQDARAALATEGIWGIEALDDAVNALRQRFHQPWPLGWSPEFETPFGLPWNLFGPVPDADQDVLDSIAAFLTFNRSRLVAAYEDVGDAANQARSALDALEELTPYGAALAAGATVPTVPDPRLVWEYHDGRRWRPLPVTGAPEALNLTGSGPVRFTVPDDAEPVTINGAESRWIRARLAEGGYGIVRLVAWTDETTGATNFFPVVEYRPPVLEKVRLGYEWRSAETPPEHCFSHNDFRFEDHGPALAGREGFTPLVPTADHTPALYLGFDGDLPTDIIGLLLDIEEQPGDSRGPALEWEAWNGSDWVAVGVQDDTRSFTVPGTLAVTWPGVPRAPRASFLKAIGADVTLIDARDAYRFAPGDLLYLSQEEKGELARLDRADDGTLRLGSGLARDYGMGTVEVATQPRFGRPGTWLRGRLAEDGPPPTARVRSLHMNAVWAEQVETFEDEVVGSSNGEPDQVFTLRHAPAVGEVRVEVRELEGPRAEIEGPLLRAELERAGWAAGDVREVRDPRTGRVREIWVRWRERRSLLFAEPEAREMVLERTRPRLVFGGRGHGRIPPAGRDNIRVARYSAGGGDQGNVARGQATQLLSGALVSGVTNPLPAVGGAVGEEPTSFLDRGPRLMRHRRQAVTHADYEDLAREASSAVAAARALPTTRGDGRAAPGWVTIRIVPRSDEPRPAAPFELRERVRRFIERRAPAAATGRIAVQSATYLPVGVWLSVRVARPEEAAPAVDDARLRLQRFLHPLSGGPEGRGWAFGRDVHLSDVAGVLAGVPGLDAVVRIAVTRDGSPVPSPVPVPPDRLVVAGEVRITIENADPEAP